MENMKKTLAKWGFTLATEAPRTELESPDPHRDIGQVKQLLAEGITPAMLLEHPYLVLTAEAKEFLKDRT